jgi:hypothetical protein
MAASTRKPSYFHSKIHLGLSKGRGVIGRNGIGEKLPKATTKFGRRAVIFVGFADHKQKHQQHGKLYRAAVFETDWSKIEQKIREVENGMRARLYEFSMNHGGTPEENRAIEDALNKLNLLRKHVTAWQGSRQNGLAG